MTAIQLPQVLGRERWSGAVIDVDVHATIASVDVVLPYLDEVWAQYIRERGWSGPGDYAYPPMLPTTSGAGGRSGDGDPRALDAGAISAGVLDPWRAEYAIVNCVYALDAGHPDLAAAMARAANDWLIAEWLEKDSRLRASIVLPSPRDPAAMAAEIRRVGDHPGFVQALLPVRSGRMYGNRMFHPLFEELQRHDLVAGIHWGGNNDGRAITAAGWPSWYAEEYAGEIVMYQAQLSNLVAEGVFQLFPDLRVAMLEGGFTWLPGWMWSAVSYWKPSRRELPWLDRSPAAIVRDHVRFSVAPAHAPSAGELAVVYSWLGTDDLLMFATDYPHEHGDDVETLLAAVPDTAKPKLMSENAREWYRLP